MDDKEKTGITVRLMTPEDLDEVAKLEQQTFSMPWSRQALSDALAREDSVYVVATVSDGKIQMQKTGGDTVASGYESVIGYSGLYLILGEGYINQVAVASDHRGKGIGKKMLSFLLESAASRGMTACSLEVRVSNEPALKLYHALGFKDAGVRPGFYEAPKEDAMILWYTV
ncbi:MAG: ribosomal protein S18-alanine N-acetyltransferase [Lachnospiraceae bacterium]|nr:ribosomal protein S18-alanine N-acetyltransferase [Lachnospiraceae bacterium]